MQKKFKKIINKVQNQILAQQRFPLPQIFCLIGCVLILIFVVLQIINYTILQLKEANIIFRPNEDKDEKKIHKNDKIMSKEEIASLQLLENEDLIQHHNKNHVSQELLRRLKFLEQNFVNKEE